MDSQLTLVNPAPPTVYFLSANDLRDTVVFSQPSVPLYRITADTRQITISDVPADRTIAVLQRRDILSDTISFPHRHITNLSVQRWLRRSKSLHTPHTFVFDTEYGGYLWRVLSRSQVKVFADYDLENPVATCYCHRSHLPGKPAFVLHAAGEALRDDIVVAYFIHRYRVMQENKALDLFVGPN